MSKRIKRKRRDGSGSEAVLAWSLAKMTGGEAVLIPLAESIGKSGANAISDPNGTRVTTRPRWEWIFELRPTSARSETTEYSRDRDSFDRPLDRYVVGLVGLDQRRARVRSTEFMVGGHFRPSQSGGGAGALEHREVFGAA
jgi:hypothetical protein